MSTPITCHALNTLTGKPADNLKATMTLLSPTNLSRAPTYQAMTDSDGRVKDWLQMGDSPSLGEAVSMAQSGDKVAWSINFEVGSWYQAQGIECFWPEIEIKFWVNKDVPHYHVPLLVGPWTYTTYRGS